jgi:hypothetical protein
MYICLIIYDYWMYDKDVSYFIIIIIILRKEAKRPMPMNEVHILLLSKNVRLSNLCVLITLLVHNLIWVLMLTHVGPIFFQTIK